MSPQFELYAESDSVINRLDPRTKIIGVFVVFAISVIFTNPLFLGPLFFMIITISLLGGVPFSKVAILLKSLSVLVVLSLVMWPLLYHPGKEIFRYGSIYITDLGIAYGVGMAFRILNMVIAPIILMLTTRQRELILGLRGVGLPQKAAFALATTFRFLPMVVGTGNGIIEAQRSRGLDTNKGNIFIRMKNYAAILGPLIINSLRTAQQLAFAVESKAMSSTAKRTTFRPLHFSKLDTNIMISYGVLMLVVIILRVLGLGVFNF